MFTEEGLGEKLQQEFTSTSNLWSQFGSALFKVSHLKF